MFQSRSAKFAVAAPTPTPKKLGLPYDVVKGRIHKSLVDRIDVRAMNQMNDQSLRNELKAAIEDIFLTNPDLISFTEKDQLTAELIDEMIGFGPLEILFRDSAISDILINGPNDVYVERLGAIERSKVRFTSRDQLLRVIQRIACKAGRRIDESSPMVDARLPDGSRFNAVIAPLAIDGALVSIRRSTTQSMTPLQFVEAGSLSSEMLEFLQAAIRARLNIIVSGGTGSGKTTLLNMLSGFVAPHERIVTIEDAAELKLRQPHVARLETRPANIEGSGCVTTRDLVKNALRMRPDRIIVGECRGAEAFDMLQAMNTGHDGSMTTLHANGATDALQRLEMLVGISQQELSMWCIQRQISSSVDLVVHVARSQDGVRRITEISQLARGDQDELVAESIFSHVESLNEATGQVQGRFHTHGVTPRAIDQIRASGCVLSPNLFQTCD
ncbi:CpaF family protein [Blastopirellula marina]|uniref:Secretory protein kinase n=1 Tax=Blastopirellula marina DSM 3645 TaxID=314230 RepID=A3ZZA7_9BACT|nr:CpaF family protein [Blastopirellula marina]EAQ78170.1 secretory protein kinase [Blastopirellula marina DSM 3645]